MADLKISELTAYTLPIGTDLAPVVDITNSTTKKITLANLGIIGGWIPLGACTYEASDDPIYTFSFASDMTAILGVGMRIKLTDSGTQYFIIHAVGAYSGGKTIITGYGGTDYNLSGGAITYPYYSTAKAPFGFPADPTKWTEELSDATSVSQASPAASTWYNIGSLSLSIPIGIWNVFYAVNSLTNSTNSTANIVMFTSLSNSNNSESDAEMTVSNGGTFDNQSSFKAPASRQQYISLAAKTTYYLIAKCGASTPDSLYFRGDQGKTIIRAVCAYL